MGGLDARYMISRLGMHDRVQSLTTIGTPHRGSARSPTGAFAGSVAAVQAVAATSCGIPTDAFDDLTTRALRPVQRNECRMCPASATIPSPANVRDICCRPCGGPRPESLPNEEGPNDGVVSVAVGDVRRRLRESGTAIT